MPCSAPAFDFDLTLSWRCSGRLLFSWALLKLFFEGGSEFVCEIVAAIPLMRDAPLTSFLIP